MAKYQERKRREAKAEERRQRRERGEKVGGREPKQVEDKVDPKAQYNFTDPQSRIMKTKDGFQQCYNAQAAVEVESMLVLADTGYYSQSDVETLEESGVEAFVAVERQAHRRSLASIPGEEEPAPPER